MIDAIAQFPSPRSSLTWRRDLGTRRDADFEDAGLDVGVADGAQEAPEP
jgi:hypothetical protein